MIVVDTSVFLEEFDRVKEKIGRSQYENTTSLSKYCKMGYELPEEEK